MRPLILLVDLITSDTLTLVASGVLALAVLALLVLVAWPSRQEAPVASPRSPRSAEARALAASGTPAAEIARRTGLSRDALALMTGVVPTSARQKQPPSARPSLFRRLRGASNGDPIRAQVTV